MTAGECQGISVIDDFHAVILADDHLSHNIILTGNDFTADIFGGSIKTFFFPQRLHENDAVVT